MIEIFLKDDGVDPFGIKSIKVTPSEIRGFHILNGGLSVHLADGSSIGTKRPLQKILAEFELAAGPDVLKKIPVVMESHEYGERDATKRSGYASVRKVKLTVPAFDL